MPIIDATNDFFIRTSDPRHKEQGRRDHAARLRQRLGRPRASTRAGTARAAPTSRPSASSAPARPARSTRSRSSGCARRTGSSASPPSRSGSKRSTRSGPTSSCPTSAATRRSAFIKGGLEDVSLSRPTLKWGVPLPWDPEQRMYVWFDALLNYVTALGFAREGEDLTERFWPASLHVMAKDILKFHAVIWPALLLAADLEPPRRMTIHGYLLMGEKKMSKSLGNVLDPFEVIDRFGADALRFYCFREVSFGQDGSISTAGFEARYETELANDFGNLASRVLAMVDRYRDGVVPEAAVDAVLAEDFEGVVRALLRAARPGRADPGAGGGLEAGAAAQPLRRGDAALGAGQGRGRPRAPRRGPLQPGRGPAGDDAAARPLPAADAARRCSRRSAKRRASWPSSAPAPAARASSGSRRSSRRSSRRA